MVHTFNVRKYSVFKRVPVTTNTIDEFGNPAANIFREAWDHYPYRNDITINFIPLINCSLNRNETCGFPLYKMKILWKGSLLEELNIDSLFHVNENYGRNPISVLAKFPSLGIKYNYEDEKQNGIKSRRIQFSFSTKSDYKGTLKFLKDMGVTVEDLCLPSAAHLSQTDNSHEFSFSQSQSQFQPQSQAQSQSQSQNQSQSQLYSHSYSRASEIQHHPQYHNSREIHANPGSNGPRQLYRSTTPKAFHPATNSFVTPTLTFVQPQTFLRNHAQTSVPLNAQILGNWKTFKMGDIPADPYSIRKNNLPNITIGKAPIKIYPSLDMLQNNELLRSVREKYYNPSSCMLQNRSQRPFEINRDYALQQNKAFVNSDYNNTKNYDINMSRENFHDYIIGKLNDPKFRSFVEQIEEALELNRK